MKIEQSKDTVILSIETWEEFDQLIDNIATKLTRG